MATDTIKNPVMRNLADYFDTIGGDVIGAPKAIYDTVTNPKQAIVDPLQTLVGQSRQQFSAGQPVKGTVSAIESGIPFLGPMAAGITNDVSQGNYGKAAGHLTSAAGLAEMGDEAASGARGAIGKQLGRASKPAPTIVEPSASRISEALNTPSGPSARQAFPKSGPSVTAHPGSRSGIQQIMDLVDTYGVRGKTPYEPTPLSPSDRGVPFPYVPEKFAPASARGIDRLLDITDASRNGKIQPFSPSTVQEAAPYQWTEQSAGDFGKSIRDRLADPNFKPPRQMEFYDSATPEEDLDIPAFLRRGNVPRLPSTVEDWAKSRVTPPTTDIGKYRSVEELIKNLKNKFPSNPKEGK